MYKILPLCFQAYNSHSYRTLNSSPCLCVRTGGNVVTPYFGEKKKKKKKEREKKKEHLSLLLASE